MALKALIFDLDGVLADTAELHYLAWKRLAEELGLAFDRAQNEALKGVSRMGSFEIILKNNGKSDAFTPAEKETLITRKNEYYKALVEQLTEKDILRGIPELLAEARAAGLKTAVASVSKNAPRVLERLGLAPCFDAVADPAKVKRQKPDPEIFLTCAEQLGADPVECVGLEDSQAGVEAILGAGMFAVGVHVAAGGPEPDWMVDSTAELTLARLTERFAAKQRKQGE